MSAMYVKINVIIVRQEIKINSDQIPKKIALFCKLPLIFAMPFCVLPFSVYASLHTAFLRDTFLHAGSLRYPSLRVASLRDAFLHVGSLRDAPLRVASLRYAFLRAGSLRYAFLRVASLSYASLRAAS